MASVSIPIDVRTRQARQRGDAIIATDGELLMRFVRHRDQRAFADIVDRHGRLVWMVCHQILRQRQDVEDAFQATFLILAQRAGGIRATQSAAAWLYTVAQRTAFAARRKRAQRREESLLAEPPQGEEALPLINDRQMMFVLMEELRGLPARYRAPLVLRYLEGQSRRSIAEQTDSTLGQIQGRLVRGRRMLRSRLIRRGVSLSLAAGVVTNTTAAADAAITPALVADTASSCLEFKTPGAAVGATPAALALAKEGMKLMWIASLTKLGGIVATALVAAGIVLASQQGGGQGAGPPAAAVELQTSATQAAERETAPAVAVAAGNPEGGAEAVREDKQAPGRLLAAIEELRAAFNVETQKKAQLVAQLELQQLEKTLAQRELEHWHGIQMRLASPSEIAANEAESQLSVPRREKLLEEAIQKIHVLKDQLESEVRKSAALTAEVELADVSRAGHQRQLDVLERMRAQTEYSQETPRAAQAATTVSPYMKLFREDQDGTLNRSPNANLEAGDMLRVQVQNAFADQPIDGIYAIEPMGTLPLGPSYGRVKVAGMTIFEAEIAIKRHLARLIEDPLLQVTMHEAGPEMGWAPNQNVSRQPAAEQQLDLRGLDLLREELQELRFENDELKLQIDMLKSPAPETEEDADDSKTPDP